jgi:hypothetical protein
LKYRHYTRKAMKSNTGAKNTTKKNRAKKRTATKAATPPKALPVVLRKKQGVWVFSTGQPITSAQIERLHTGVGHVPQGLKPASLLALDGTPEGVPSRTQLFPIHVESKDAPSAPERREYQSSLRDLFGVLSLIQR